MTYDLQTTPAYWWCKNFEEGHEYLKPSVQARSRLLQCSGFPVVARRQVATFAQSTSERAASSELVMALHRKHWLTTSGGGLRHNVLAQLWQNFQDSVIVWLCDSVLSRSTTSPCLSAVRRQSTGRGRTGRNTYVHSYTCHTSTARFRSKQDSPKPQSDIIPARPHRLVTTVQQSLFLERCCCAHSVHRVVLPRAEQLGLTSPQWYLVTVSLISDSLTGN